MRNALYLHLTQEETPSLCIEELPKGRILSIEQAYSTPELTLMKTSNGDVYVHYLRISYRRGIGHNAPIKDAMLRALTGLKVITKKQADDYRALQKKWTESMDTRQQAREARNALKACGIAVPVTIERQLKKLEGAK